MAALIPEPVLTERAADPGVLDPQVRSASGHGVDPRRAWWVLTVTLVLGLVTGEPRMLAVNVLLLSLLAALALATRLPGRAAVAAAVPAGFVLVVTWALLWGLTMGWIGRDAWSSRYNALLGVLAFVGATAIPVFRSPVSRVPLVGRERTAVAASGAFLVGSALLVVLQPFEIWSRIHAPGTDFLRHVESVRSVWQEGVLVPGEPGYPRALYSLGSLAGSAMGMPTSAASIWQGVAILSFLMLGLVLLGLMVIARWTASCLGLPPAGASLAAWLSALAFVQTAWFSVFLAQGNLMNMLVGICLVAPLVLGTQDRALGSLPGWIVAAAAVAVTANAWQLVAPVAAAVALAWIPPRGILFRPAAMTSSVVAAMLVLNGALALRAVDGSAQTSIVTVSGLFWPDWWWFAALVLALAAVVGLFRGRHTRWAVCALSLLVSGVALVALLMVATSSSTDWLLYYPAKTLWSIIVLAIPLASAMGIALVRRIWLSAPRRQPVPRTLTRVGLALVVGTIAAGALGRVASAEPHVLGIVRGGDGVVSWQLALLDALEGRLSPPSADAEVVVFGLVPSATLGDVVGGYVGSVDYLAMEAMDNLGFRHAERSPVKPGLAMHEAADVCQFLRQQPEAIRVTGPNPRSGAAWLLEAGCPASVVRASDWVVARLDGAWLSGTRWELSPSDAYPAFAEAQAFVAGA